MSACTFDICIKLLLTYLPSGQTQRPTDGIGDESVPTPAYALLIVQLRG